MTETTRDADVKRFLGMPMRWNLRKIFANYWNPADERLFPPKQFGIGWDVNFHALAVRAGLGRGREGR